MDLEAPKCSKLLDRNGPEVRPLYFYSLVEGTQGCRKWISGKCGVHPSIRASIFLRLLNPDDKKRSRNFKCEAAHSAMARLGGGAGLDH